MADVVVNIIDKTAPVAQAGFGLILIFDPTKDSDYQEVTKTAEISDFVAGDLTYEMANKVLSQTPTVEKLALYGVDVATKGSTITDELNQLAVDRDDFYWLLVASRIDAEIAEAASWAGGNKRVFVGQPDISIDVETELPTFMANFNTARNLIYVHDGGLLAEEQYLDAGVAGKLAPLTVGSWTGKFQTIAGVANTRFLAGDISAIHDENANTYQKKMGILQTSEGVASDGTFFDIQVCKDWLEARITENISQLLYAGSGKIPYDDSGIAQVVNRLKQVLQQAFEQGIIAGDEKGNPLYSVSYPLRKDIPVNDRANRKLINVEFEATIAGAIHNVDITGTLLA